MGVEVVVLVLVVVGWGAVMVLVGYWWWCSGGGRDFSKIIDFLSPMQYWCGGMKTVCDFPDYTVHLVLVTKEDTRRTYTSINFKTLP